MALTLLLHSAYSVGIKESLVELYGFSSQHIESSLELLCCGTQATDTPTFSHTFKRPAMNTTHNAKDWLFEKWWTTSHPARC